MIGRHVGTARREKHAMNFQAVLDTIGADPRRSLGVELFASRTGLSIFRGAMR